MQLRHRRTSSLASALALAVVASVAVSACGSASFSTVPGSNRSAGPSASAASSQSATASPNPSDLSVFATIEAQVEAIRGLHATTPVAPVLLDSKALADWLTKANAEQTDHQALADESSLFIHLGLIPAGSSLEQMELDLDAGQVIGFYDPVSKGLYVLSQSGGIGPVEKVTFAHEYTHALQDQNFGLDKLATQTADQGDRDLARTALPEGDATLLMTLWMLKSLSPAELVVVATDSGSAAQTDQLAKAPPILRQTLLFPYEQGLSFVQGIYADGGWDAVNQLYARPPDSTSQILHPELYSAHVEPVTLAVPTVPASLGPGWKLTMQDTLGELQLAVWLEGQNPSTAQTTAATLATSTWAGDRVGLYDGPNGAWAVVLDTAWRTAAGAQAFERAATTETGELPGPAVACADGDDIAVYIGSNAATLEAFASCRPQI